jgi:hypothetical protein
MAARGELGDDFADEVGAVEERVLLVETTTGRRREVPVSARCLSAGPKYRALDRGGVLDGAQIDPRDLVPLAGTLLGARVYVQEPTVPNRWRACQVVAGRPSRILRST